MTAWKTLFKKELRMGALGFFIFLIVQLMLMVLGIYLAIRNGEKGFIFGIGIFLITCHSFYLLGYMIINVFMEKKTFHLWMYNPLPGWAMIAAKLSGALVYMTCSLAVASLYTWIGYLIMSDQLSQLSQQIHVYRVGALVIAYLYWIAIYIGIAFMFLWLVQRGLKSRIGKLTWPVLLGAIAAVIYAIVKFTQWGFISALTNWGEVPASVVHIFVPGTGVQIRDTQIYLGDFVLDLAIMAVLYILSSWIMDHELEVS